MNSYSKHYIDKSDIVAVSKVLKSSHLTQGSAGIEFEKRLSEYVASKYCVTLNSATSALHTAYISLNVGTDDIVWTTSITFVATVNAAIMCGANVELLDINLDNFNIDLNLLEKSLILAKRKNKLPKVITCVHMCGTAIDMKKVKKLANIYGFKIIEDASHALGANYIHETSKVGCCKYSDITIFSFHPVKMITTGEGGAVLTNSHKIYKNILLLRSHGINKDLISNKLPKNCYYDQKILGFNYRLSDLNSALGISQLAKLDNFLLKRRKIASYYRQYLDKNKYKFQDCALCDSSYHLFVIYSKNKMNHEVLKILRNNSIPAHFHYIPIYRHSFHKNIKIINGKSNSEKYYKFCLSLPLSVHMNKAYTLKIIKILNEI